MPWLEAHLLYQMPMSFQAPHHWPKNLWNGTRGTVPRERRKNSVVGNSHCPTIRIESYWLYCQDAFFRTKKLRKLSCERSGKSRDSPAFYDMTIYDCLCVFVTKTRFFGLNRGPSDAMTCHLTPLEPAKSCADTMEATSGRRQVIWGQLLQWWVPPTTMEVFPTQNDHILGCEMGSNYHHLRKHPHISHVKKTAWTVYIGLESQFVLSYLWRLFPFLTPVLRKVRKPQLSVASLSTISTPTFDWWDVGDRCSSYLLWWLSCAPIPKWH